ncbi:MAG TPA: hypothetical protein VF636_04455 [Sphingomonas sp.]|jgi:hypothetical protein
MASAAPTLASIIATASPAAAIADLAMLPVPDDSPDAELLTAWNDRQMALAMIEERGRFFSGERHSPGAAKMFEEADMLVYKLPAETPAGILAKLWVALSFGGGLVATEEDRAETDAIRRADLAEVETFADTLDCDQEIVFGVIRNLEAQVRR